VSAHPSELDALPWISLAADLIGPMFPSAVNKGSDNRLTVMLIGSDWRPRLAGTGERTDSMIFMTINNSNQISAVSLPRDVGNVPIAPGVIYKPKINGLFKYYKSQTGLSDPLQARNAALQHMRTTFQYTFGIQIDYVVYTRFTGFERLVGNVAGVPVSVPSTIYDKSIVDERYPNSQHGAKFLAQQTTEFGSSAPACYTVGNPINWTATPNCTRALEYVRTRHGAGNNDWVRGKRQQSFIFSAIRRVITRGNGSNLDALRSSALSNSTDFYTTLPTDAASALQMFALLQYATMPNQAVLKPPTYASTVPGTFKQQLKIDAVRALMHSWFGPLP
jgi:anionic cell wall polymer biosynthesis LytR-Cps2A-Psr (LCP) family protein